MPPEESPIGREERVKSFEKWKRDLLQREEEISGRKRGEAFVDQETEKLLQERYVEYLKENGYLGETEEQALERLKREGWEVVEVLHNKADVKVEDIPAEEESMVAAFGTTFYVLKRKRRRGPPLTPGDKESVC